MSFNRLAIACALAAFAALPAQADIPLPVRVMTDAELGQLSGMPYLNTTNHSFKMAASASARAYNKPTQSLAVERKTGGTASVYRGAPSTSVPLAPPMPPTAALLEMQSNGDVAQTWAAMSAAGFPFIRATGFGDFTAEATASWHTSVTVPAGAGGRELVVRFVLPPVSVAGATEDEGRARWRARLRAELLVNGFPAWATDALRFTTDPNDIHNLSEVVVLQQFGHPLPFATNDEDSDTSNNTSAANVNNATGKLTVHLSLGRFAAGSVVDLSMLLRGTAHTVPATVNGTDHRCKWKNTADRYFCSRASVSVDGTTGESPRIYFLP